MFPSKLYEVQLSPPTRLYSFTNIFVSDLELDSEISIQQKLTQENLEMVSHCPLALNQLLHLSFGFDSEGNDYYLLMRASNELSAKIEVYIFENEQLQSEIYNCANAKRKIKLARLTCGYVLLKPLGSLQLTTVESQEDIGSLFNSVKKQSQSPNYSMRLKDEINEEGDLIIQECNKFIFEDSTIHSQSDQNEEDQPTTPPSKFIKLFNRSTEEPKSSLNSEVFGNQERHTGKLKFYDESKSYGFLIMDSDGTDIFVHSDDLLKAGVSKEYLKTAKKGNIIRFSFTCLAYIGKYNKSRKAVDLILLPQQPKYPQMFTPPHNYYYQQQQLYNYSYAQ